MFLKLTLFLFGIVVVNGFWISIPTGYVGVKTVWGKVDPIPLPPGFNWLINIPFTTQVHIIETKPQKDYLRNVDCGTNDGLKLIFDTVEVGNQLPHEHAINTVSRFGVKYDDHLVLDLVRHQLNVICSKKSAHQIAIEEFDQLDDLMKEFIQSENDRQESGVQVSFVRLSKPKMPKEIEDNYLALAEERTKMKVEKEHQERVMVEKETERKVASQNNAIKIEQTENNGKVLILEAQAEQKRQTINNEITIANAQAHAQKTIEEAKGFNALYSIPGYVDVLKAQALADNQKVYYGEKIPQTFIGYQGLEQNK